ncbi:MAG: NAAT family transporter [Elusimicrobia bacterium]|nr:NAAT family transporter [Elusimicrobiota bacterium]MBD3412508.1 NAAT family transporter [Elusimicrobiota bacterium]
MLNAYILSFIPIFVAVDVLGLVPMYMFLTEKLSDTEKNKAISMSVITALIVSIGFVFIGKGIFIILGIRVSDFLVAGGILLFIIAIIDIVSSEKKKVKISSKTVGVVPLGMPLMVGPAVLTTTLIVLDTHGFAPTLVALLTNIILVGLIFKMSHFLIKRIGVTGIQAASKLTSIMLSAYAVMMIRRGIAEIIAFYIK